MTARRVGLLGGTFDPIHQGHLDMGDAAIRALALDRLDVVPANIPPHRVQAIASAFHRFAMVSIAIAGRPHWRASDLELRVEAPSFTTDTLRRFRERGYAPAEIAFVIGADAFADIESWRDFPAILDAAHFAVVSRPGAPAADLPRRLPALAPRMAGASAIAGAARAMIFLIDAPTADVSSTAIRLARAEGRSIAGLVPPGVQQHIDQHGLYSPYPPGRRAKDAEVERAAGRLHGQD